MIEWFNRKKKQLEERRQRIEEARPLVVKILLKKGFQLSEGFKSHEEAKVLENLSLSDFLTALGSVGEDINIECFTANSRERFNYGALIGSAAFPPDYIFTDGKIKRVDDKLTSITDEVIRDATIGATYVSWINITYPDFTTPIIRETNYFLQTTRKAPEIRKFIKELDIQTLHFTFKAWR